MFLRYPYVDMYAANLDWMIQAIREVQEIIENLGHVVNTFNNRDGDVELLPGDVNSLNINILSKLTASTRIEDLSQYQLNTMYEDGTRVIMGMNTQGRYDRLYVLFRTSGSANVTYVEFNEVTDNSVTSFNGQTGDVDGVSSYNGQTGAVTGVSSFNGQDGEITGVSSVNGATGEVGISAENIPYDSDIPGTSIADKLASELDALSDELYAAIAPIESMVFPEDGQPGSFLQLDNQGAPVWGGSPYIVIDTTLSVSGEAADAKVTGDTIRNDEIYLQTLFDNTDLNTHFRNTASITRWNDTYGYVTSDANQITIRPAKRYPFDIIVDFRNLTKYRISRTRIFNTLPYTPANYASSTDNDNDIVTIPRNTWFSFEIFETAGETSALTDLENVLFYASEQTDANLNKTKMPADGKATGDAITAVSTAMNSALGNTTLPTIDKTVKGAIKETWDDIHFIAEDSTLNAFLQDKFVLWRWNDTYGYVANDTAMSIVTPVMLPFDVTVKNLHYPNFTAAVVRTFTYTNSNPAYLVDTTNYSMQTAPIVSEITLPKNTYWTIMFVRPGNVSIDLNTYKLIPQFVVGNNIRMENQLILNTTRVVGKKMSPYTKIQDAVDAANAGDTILILPGTYEEDVSAFGKEVHLIGLDRDSTIIIERTGLYSKPPLEINVGSVRNLTLIETGEGSVWGDDDGKGRAYTIHIENGTGYTGTGELWIENCKLINYAHATVGCGLYQDLHVHFNNCYMYSGRAQDVLDDYYRGTFYYHTNIAENVTGQRMTVKDCEIINAGTKAFYGGVATPGATTGNVRSTFINNNFYAMSAANQNSNDICVVYNILNYHDCKLNPNSRGNNIPIMNAP